jgi:hypothetical protein
MLDREWEAVNVEREGKDAVSALRGFMMVVRGKTFDVAGETKREGVVS